MAKTSDPQTWFITGASSGLGLAIALAALKAGENVIGTARNIVKAKAECETVLGEYYSSSSSPWYSWRQLDVTQEDLDQVVKEIVEEEDVDVLVCNAGYGLYGALEDMSQAEIRAQMETNFFGTTFTLHASLPHFRTRHTRKPPANPATLVIMSSISGLFVSSPSGIIYSASKSALEAIAEGLALQMAPFGTRVLLVEPGLFRTNWLKDSYVTPERFRESWGVSEAYASSGVGEALRAYPELHGRQEGDAWKAGRAVVGVVLGKGLSGGEEGHGVGKELDEELGRNWEGVRGCLRLPLGGDAVAKWEEWEGRMKKNVEAVRSIAESTRCDDMDESV